MGVGLRMDYHRTRSGDRLTQMSRCRARHRPTYTMRMWMFLAAVSWRSPQWRICATALPHKSYALSRDRDKLIRRRKSRSQTRNHRIQREREDAKFRFEIYRIVNTRQLQACMCVVRGARRTHQIQYCQNSVRSIFRFLTIAKLYCIVNGSHARRN